MISCAAILPLYRLREPEDLADADDLGHQGGVERAEKPVDARTGEPKGVRPVRQVGRREADGAGGEGYVVRHVSDEPPREARPALERHPLSAECVVPDPRAPDVLDPSRRRL